MAWNQNLDRYVQRLHQEATPMTRLETLLHDAFTSGTLEEFARALVEVYSTATLNDGEAAQSFSRPGGSDSENEIREN